MPRTGPSSLPVYFIHQNKIKARPASRVVGEGQDHILEVHVGEQVFLELCLENAVNYAALLFHVLVGWLFFLQIINLNMISE